MSSRDVRTTSIVLGWALIEHLRTSDASDANQPAPHFSFGSSASSPVPRPDPERQRATSPRQGSEADTEKNPILPPPHRRRRSLPARRRARRLPADDPR